MVDANELIRIARALASGALGSGRGRPRQSELRRAVSMAYYAMFHALARQSADMLVGATRRNRSQQAWRQAYRSLEHGLAAAQCRRPIIRRFPAEIRRFGEKFVDLQRMRHDADYDPDVSYTRLDALRLVEVADSAIWDFERADVVDKRAFAVYVMFRSRVE